MKIKPIKGWVITLSNKNGHYYNNSTSALCGERLPEGFFSVESNIDSRSACEKCKTVLNKNSPRKK